MNNINKLGDLDCAYTLARESASEQKWKHLAEPATSQANFELAHQCLHEDHGDLLLLATAGGNADMVAKPGLQADQAGKHNVSFLSYFLLGDLEMSGDSPDAQQDSLGCLLCQDLPAQ